MAIRLQIEAGDQSQRFYRLAYASLLVSILLLVLFAVSAAGDHHAEPALRVSKTVAAIAGLNAVVAVLTLWLGKRAKHMMWTPVCWGSLAVTVGVLIHVTGGTNSPYAVLWMLIAVVGGLFGWGGIILLAGVANGYLAWQFTSGSSQNEHLLLLILAANLPLLVGYILWRGLATGSRPETETASSGPPAQLVKNASQSEIVINSIADGVIAVDAQGVIQLINPAAQSLLGWPASDARGLHHESVLKLLDKRDQPVVSEQNPLEEVKNTKQPMVNNNLTLVSKADKKMLVSLVISPVLEDKKVTNVIVVFRDITVEKAREREQAEFVSTASHEMRTPVAAIEGYLALVANPKTANIDDKARLYLEKAQESVKHLGRLFQDLLTVSRAEDGRLEEHPQVTDIVGFTGSITESLQPKAAEKDLELRFQPSTDSKTGGAHDKVMPIYYANVDRDHLREVTANLIENAIKYTKQGKVTVDVTGDEKTIKVSIEDTGIGIAQEDIPHLFQKFYRVDNSDTREVGGTGLGLSIARKLAESMHGNMWVESELGKGSTFFLTLPRINNTEIKQLQQSEAIEALQLKKAGAVKPQQPPKTPPAAPSPKTGAPTATISAPKQAPAKPAAPKPAAPVVPPPVIPQSPAAAPSKPIPAAPKPVSQPKPAAPELSASTQPKDTTPGPVPGAPEIKNPASSQTKPPPKTPTPPTPPPTSTAPVISDITNVNKPSQSNDRGHLTVPGRPLGKRGA